MSTSRLGRYKDIGLLLAKHARAGYRIAAADAMEDLAGEDLEADAAQLASELEEMGPTFVKLGQLLSTRADVLPEPYLRALGRLQDRVEPFPFAEVERIVERELTFRLSKGFRSFDHRPLAAASLGQVHRAEMRDGRPVAVKVQRPGIRDQILEDMDAIERIATLVDEHTEAGQRFGFADMVEEFRRSLMAELDYRHEATNLETLAHNLADHPRIVVPAPIRDYTTGVVLTMTYIEGRNVASLGPLALMEIDRGGLADALFAAYLDQILVDGFFHADPHPGNVLVTDDGRLALLDLGMVARVAPEEQDQLVKLLLAISDGRGRDASDVLVDMGRKVEGFDADELRRRASDLITRHQGTTMADLQAGSVIGELTGIAGACGLRLPPELTMLGKALLNLDEVARTLDPDFDPNEAIERESSDLLRKKLVQSAAPASLMSAVMEAREFTERLPGRVNKVLDSLAEGRLTLNVQGIDEKDLMRTAQKLANRITGGVIVAALIIGAALIMRVDTATTLFGYPALAIILFLIAAAAGLLMLVSIWVSDLPQRRSRFHGSRRRR